MIGAPPLRWKNAVLGAIALRLSEFPATDISGATATTPAYWRKLELWKLPGETETKRMCRRLDHAK